MNTGSPHITAEGRVSCFAALQHAEGQVPSLKRETRGMTRSPIAPVAHQHATADITFMIQEAAIQRKTIGGQHRHQMAVLPDLLPFSVQPQPPHRFSSASVVHSNRGFPNRLLT